MKPPEFVCASTPDADEWSPAWQDWVKEHWACLKVVREGVYHHIPHPCGTWGGYIRFAKPFEGAVYLAAMKAEHENKHP